MTKEHPEITVYGATWCQDCHRVKQYLGAHHVDYRWIDVDKSEKAAEKIMAINDGNRTIPTIEFADGSVLVNPSNHDLAAKLDIVSEQPVNYHDLVIIGAGPTGLSAAIYTTREDISTVLYEKAAVGGLAGSTDMIDNYPGFPEGVSGLDLSEAMENQARRFGAEFMTGIEVKSITDEGKYKRIVTNEGEQFAKAILIATGSTYRKLGIPGEHEMTGRGVHYCATCDGPLYRGKRLVVIGGGNSAMQESLFLTKFAEEITMLVRGPELKGTEIIMEKTLSTPKIKVVYNVTPTEILSRAGKVAAVEGVSTGTDKTVRYGADGVFVFIGLYPNTEFLKRSVKLDHAGFVMTDKMFETSTQGVFAAGDVRHGATWQIASAVGEGVTAALMIREYLKDEG